MQNETLKRELQSFIHSKEYEKSIGEFRSILKDQPNPLEINPILQKIKNENLSFKQKRELFSQIYFPSMPNEIYYQWIAPDRISIKRDRQWYINVFLIALFIIFFGIIAKSMMIVAVILAVLFALYVNASVPAKETVYKITLQGIEIGEGEEMEIFPWEHLLEYAYYFKEGHEILYVYTITGLPERLELLYSEEDRNNINMLMEMHLPYKPPPKKQGLIKRFLDGYYIPLNEFKLIQEKIDSNLNDKYSLMIERLKEEGKIPQDVTVEQIREAEYKNFIERVKKIQEMKNNF